MSEQREKLEVRLLVTKAGKAVVLVKAATGTLMVLTAAEAVEVANSLLDVAQAAKETDDSTA
jgi:hypothetical protein